MIRLNAANVMSTSETSHVPLDQEAKHQFLGSLSLEDSPQRLDDSGPVFIMGCPRSGTTVLADCISAIRDIILRIGILIPDRMMHLLGSGQVPDEVQEDLLWSQRYILWRSFLDAYLSRLTSLQDAVRTRNLQTLWRRNRSPGELLFAYKEPFLVFAASLFARHFKQSKFINIIRDGRDCADSMIRTYPQALVDQVLQDPLLWRLKGSEIGVARPWHGWYLPWWLPEGCEEEFTRLRPFARSVVMWQVMVRETQQLAKTLGPDRLLELRYEELCERPQEVGERLLAFLGRSSSWSFQRVLRSMTPRSVGCHKRQSAEVLEEANRVGQPLLRELGYP